MKILVDNNKIVKAIPLDYMTNYLIKKGWVDVKYLGNVMFERIITMAYVHEAFHADFKTSDNALHVTKWIIDDKDDQLKFCLLHTDSVL